MTFSFSVLPGPRTMSDRVERPCLTLGGPSPESLSLSGTSQAGSGLCQEASVSSWAQKGTTSSTSNQPRRETAFQPHPLLSSGYRGALTTPLHPSRLQEPRLPTAVLGSCFFKSAVCILFALSESRLQCKAGAGSSAFWEHTRT